MTSVRKDGSSDVTSAYQRAIAREEKGVNSDEHVSAVESPQPRLRSQYQPKSDNDSDSDSDSDLYRHHSQQQSAEGG